MSNSTPDRPAHAILSPSTGERYLNCPGSVELCRGVPEQRSHYADEGQLAHKLAEDLLTGKVQFSEIGTTYDGQNVPPDMAESVMLFINTCMRDRITATHFGIEQTVTLDWLWIRAGKKPPTPMYGTADWIALLPSVLVVRDYKHGAGVFVPVLDNVQMMKYGLGGLHWCDMLGLSWPDKVEISITQPRSRSGGEHTRTETYYTMDLLSWAEKVLVPGAERAWNDKGKTLIPGPWCKKTFCRARRICPALHAEAVKTAQEEFDTPSGVQTKFRDPSAMTNDELGTALKKAEVFFDGINEFIKGCRAEASARIDRGQAVPGWKLVPKRSNRTWKQSEEKTLEWIEGNALVPVDDFIERKISSVAAVERTLKRVGLNIEDFPQADQYIEKKSTGTTLAPEKTSVTLRLPDPPRISM